MTMWVIQLCNVTVRTHLKRDKDERASDERRVSEQTFPASTRRSPDFYASHDE